MAPPLSDEQKEILHELYYDDKNFVGRDGLWRLARSKYPDANISRRQTMDWLKTQEVHQLFRGTRPTKSIKISQIKKPFNQIGIDLIDMTGDQFKGFKWILTAIDLHSKKAWAQAIKNKKPTSVANGMKTILSRMSKTPKSIRSDNGNEFLGQPFQTLLNKKEIKHITSIPGKPQSNGQVERFNGILKRRLAMNETYTDSQNWVGELQNIVNNYNDTYQRMIKMTPNEAESAGHSKDINEDNAKRADESRRRDNTKDFEIGDVVRIKLDKGDYDKKSSTISWSRELYVIGLKKKGKLMATSYRVIDPDGDVIKKAYYNNDLLLVTSVNNPVKVPEKYTISKLIDRVKRGRDTFYEVKWLGYRETTLEPRDQLMRDVPKLVEAYDRELDGK